MDETNPAYENFLNNMTRMSRTPRETTRKVSASKFLGIEKLADAIQINSRKISILKDIIKAQRLQTGAMIASLSKNQESEGVIESVTDIKRTMSSILQTLQAQDQLETRKFLREMRELENEKRRKREKKLELSTKVGRSIQKTLDRALSPVKNIFNAILGGIVKLFLGKVLLSLINFLANPRNRGVLNFITGTIETVFAVLNTGVGRLLIALPILLGALAKVAGLLGFQAFGGGVASGAGGFLGAGAGSGKGSKGFMGIQRKVPITTNIGKPIGRGFRFPRIRFNQGGVVPGIGNQDTVPAMLTPGEFVVKKDVVGVLGLPFFERLNRSFSQLKNFYNQGRNVRFPNENAAKLKDLVKDDFSQITRTDKAFKEGAKGLKGARPLKAFTPRMMKTGPTPLTRQIIERPVRTMFGTTVSGFAKRLPILDLLLDLAFPKPLADGTLTGNSAAISGDNINPVPNLLPMNVNSVSKTSLPNFGDLPSIPEPDQSTDIRNDIIDVSLNSPSVEKMETLGMMQ